MDANRGGVHSYKDAGNDSLVWVPLDTDSQEDVVPAATRSIGKFVLDENPEVPMNVEAEIEVAPQFQGLFSLYCVPPCRSACQMPQLFAGHAPISDLTPPTADESPTPQVTQREPPPLPVVRFLDRTPGRVDPWRGY